MMEMLNMDSLIELGWNDFLAESFRKLIEPGLQPARIISQQKNLFRVDDINRGTGSSHIG